MEKRELHTSKIEGVRFEGRQNVVSRLIGRIVPGLGQDTDRDLRDGLKPGDRVIFHDGKSRRLSGIVPSVEGVRHAFSELPNPSDQE